MEIDPLQVAAGDFLCHYLSLGMRTAAVVCTPRHLIFLLETAIISRKR